MPRRWHSKCLPILDRLFTLLRKVHCFRVLAEIPGHVNIPKKRPSPNMPKAWSNEVLRPTMSFVVTQTNPRCCSFLNDKLGLTLQYYLVCNVRTSSLAIDILRGFTNNFKILWHCLPTGKNYLLHFSRYAWYLYIKFIDNTNSILELRSFWEK